MSKKINKPLFTSLICVFSLALILLLFNVFTAFAGPIYVAEVNGTKYENYTDAWNAVSNGGTITMLADWTTNKVLTVNEGKTVTINMNGFMINRNLNDDESNGEVFLVDDDATLTINGQANSTNEHKGTIQNDVWHYNKNGNHSITGALITGGYNSNGGGAIHILENATVTITNVTIAGNISTDGDGSGAIRLEDDDSKLILIDSEICYNKATDDDGGAIGVEGDDTDVQIIGTKIHHNIVTEWYCYGGAIQIDGGTVTIKKSANRVSELSFNSATRKGGAICVSDGNLFIEEGTIFAHNESDMYGGAIFADSGADVVEIKGIFSGNRAAEEGGAIYVDCDVSGNTGVTISNAEFLGNSAAYNGGAIYVDTDNDFSLSGKVIAIGNTPNNLYIDDEDTIVSNNLTQGSRVGITTSWDATQESPIETPNYQYFISDKQGYLISGGSNTVYYVASQTDIPDQITYGSDTYPIHKDSFVYHSVESGQMTAYYYYSDGYFVDSAKYYNDHLATMSTCVAISAVTAAYEGDYTEAKGAQNVVALFESAGFTNIFVHYPKPEFYGKDNEILSTIGYVIASKEITINGETITLIAIAVRGGEYGAEWASNVTLGDGIGEARGFGDAANQVEKGIYEYIENYNIDTSDSKFWISGFSRAAATSNLVAKRLTDSYGEDRVYAYCFETPKGGVFDQLKDGLHYSNIHNMINGSDIVTYVGTTEMGFIRYGVDHMFPAYLVGNSEYEKQREEMLAQLAAINPNFTFDDYFHEATIEYIGGTIQGWFGDADYISEVWIQDYGKAELWIPAFFKFLQEYSLTNNIEGSIYNKDSENWYGYRHYWSTYPWYLYEDNGNLLIKCYETAPSDIANGKYTVLTIEDSIGNLMNFYFGADDAKKAAIMKALDLNAIMGSLNLTDIYWDIIGKWNDFTIDEKNEQFNKIWNTTGIETQLATVLEPEEIKDLKTSFCVVLDFLLDFVCDDYDENDQDMLGTLVYNIFNILQTHYYDVVCAWVRSYDSFYASGDLVSPPLPPRPNLTSGTYNTDISIQLTADNTTTKIYYTLDGTTPNPNSNNCALYSNPIRLEMEDGKPKSVTLKVIAVNNGLTSEVATYTYVLNTNAEISVNKDFLRVYNFNGSAYLILAEYNDGILQNVEYFEVTNNSYLDLTATSLNFDHTVVAYLVKDLTSFTPLCDSLCLTDSMDRTDHISMDVQTAIAITAFEAKQAENPEFINVTLKATADNADCLIIALFEKNSKSEFGNVLYFNQVTKSNDNTYTFTIRRSLLQQVLNGGSVDGHSYKIPMR